MKAEDHVPTLETCRKLKEIGIEFDSYFIWQKYEDIWYITDFTGDVNFLSSYEAPGVQELLKKAPPHIKKDGWLGIQPLRIEFGFGECEVTYGINGSKAVNTIMHKNLAEALSQMLLWLHENNYLDKK